MSAPFGYEQDIPLSQIDIGGRFRDLDEDAAAQLALSIGERGLNNAITVRALDDGRYELVAGMHRLRAHELLDLDEVRCFVRDLTDDEAEIVEIEENFFRLDLSVAERQLSVGRWMQAYKAARPEIQHGGDSKSEDSQIKFQGLELDRADEVLSLKMGRSKSSIYDDFAVFNSLGPEVLEQLAGSPISDNAAQIKALAKLPPEDRPEITARLCDGRASTVKEAVQFDPDMPPRQLPKSEQFLKRIRKAWVSGDTRHRGHSGSPDIRRRISRPAQTTVALCQYHSQLRRSGRWNYPSGDH